MACATLKRSLDFEPPMCRPTKRQRCTPMSISPSSSPPNSSRSEYVSPHFGGDVVPKITAEMLSASLTEEVQRMRRKRQLNMELSENRNLEDSSSSDSSSENTFPSSAKDKPLFTFRQVKQFNSNKHTKHLIQGLHHFHERIHLSGAQNIP